MEAIKSRRTNILVLLLSFGFLLLSSCAFGQSMEILRAPSYDYKLGIKTTVRYPNYGIPIESKINKNDLIALSIRADSIVGYIFNAQIFVETKDADKYKNHKLIITLENNVILSLKPLYSDKDYIEYIITHLDADAISKNKIINIEFANGVKYSINKDYNTFFIDFLKIIS
jgi:hypothetical protein